MLDNDSKRDKEVPTNRSNSVAQLTNISLQVVISIIPHLIMVNFRSPGLTSSAVTPLSEVLEVDAIDGADEVG